MIDQLQLCGQLKQMRALLNPYIGTKLLEIDRHGFKDTLAYHCSPNYPDFLTLKIL